MHEAAARLSRQPALRSGARQGEAGDGDEVQHRSGHGEGVEHLVVPEDLGHGVGAAQGVAQGARRVAGPPRPRSARNRRRPAPAAAGARRPGRTTPRRCRGWPPPTWGLPSTPGGRSRLCRRPATPGTARGPRPNPAGRAPPRRCRTRRWRRRSWSGRRVACGAGRRATTGCGGTRHSPRTAPSTTARTESVPACWARRARAARGADRPRGWRRRRPRATSRATAGGARRWCQEPVRCRSRAARGPPGGA